jgi:hypothetical protein
MALRCVTASGEKLLIVLLPDEPLQRSVYFINV